MKLIYITLNNNEEARKIGNRLLKENLANCVNFFPITCIYNYEDKITEESEVVLIVKTNDKNYDKVRSVVQEEINYDNFIGQISIEKINESFEKWLLDVVK